MRFLPSSIHPRASKLAFSVSLTSWAAPPLPPRPRVYTSGPNGFSEGLRISRDDSFPGARVCVSLNFVRRSGSELVASLFYRKLGPQRMLSRLSAAHTADCVRLVHSFCSREDRVLDLACGAGRVAVPLAASGMDVTGVDLSPSMVDAAKTGAARAACRICLTVGSMLALPFAAGSFTRVFCFRAFGHLLRREEQMKAIGEVLRVMADEGMAVFEVGDGESKQPREHVETAGIGPDHRVVRVPVGNLVNMEYVHNKASLSRLGADCGVARYEVKFTNLAGQRRITLWLRK